MRGITLAIAIALAGCGGRSGIIQSGPDTYTVIVAGRSGFVSSADLKLSAYRQASGYCSRSGRTLEVLEESSKRTGGPGQFPEAQLKFRCNP